MRLKIYYKVTHPLQYNFVETSSISVDGKPFKDVESFDNKSILTFTRKARKLEFELFDIFALSFKSDISNSLFTIFNTQCNVGNRNPFFIGNK